MTWLRSLMGTWAPSAVTLVRLIVGALFLSEGIQQWLYPATLDAGRFAKIGAGARDVWSFLRLCGNCLVAWYCSDW
jgi:uncharacterized membrane protein YphA (DoxX/SURF4 family)